MNKTPCCPVTVASWVFISTAMGMRYAGQARTQCRLEQAWSCDHFHKSREAAVTCAEKYLRSRERMAKQLYNRIR